RRHTRFSRDWSSDVCSSDLGAAYAVASGAYDIAMAVGVEKVKDSGYQGAVGAGRTPTDGTERTLTAAAMYSMIVPAYAKKYGVRSEERRVGKERRSRWERQR